jgi:hypothetical protein
MNRFTAVEAAIAFAICGGAAAAIIPSCLSSLRTRRTSEATEHLDRIAQAAVTCVNSGKELAPTPLTPAIVPRGSATSDPPGTWEHPTWRAVSFALDEPHWFAYRIDVDPGRAIKIVAHGDLDGDGVLSTYERQVTRDGAKWALSPAVIVTADLE